jgi:enamine deaminase RidA (YjgF/YER057c/UK114 family)
MKSEGIQPGRHQQPRVVREQHSPTCRISRFGPPDRAEEVHLFIEPHSDGSFEEQLGQVVAQYHRALESLDLARHTGVFRRCFLSDAANQLETVVASPLGLAVPPAEAAAVSCIEQPPLCYRKIALLAYHIRDVEPEAKSLIAIPGAGPYARTLVLERPERTLLWTAQMNAQAQGTCEVCSMKATQCSIEQTRGLLSTYCDHLRSQGGSLSENAVRTWVFVDSVDTHYSGMVQARRELFACEGLTARTHYVVSTGIEGRSAQARSVVTLDALAVLGLGQGQIAFVDCLDHLNRTDEYGVTFERAARLDCADRSHVLVAGTASIGASGEIVHEGNVLRQLERVLENISALLEVGSASLDDMAAMIVYLRDASDAERVVSFLDETHPGLRFATVHAPICRSAWLVEIEGVAITANEDSRWPPF